MNVLVTRIWSQEPRARELGCIGPTPLVGDFVEHQGKPYKVNARYWKGEILVLLVDETFKPQEIEALEKAKVT